jgi:hypothetical protein
MSMLYVSLVSRQPRAYPRNKDACTYPENPATHEIRTRREEAALSPFQAAGHVFVCVNS